MGETTHAKVQKTRTRRVAWAEVRLTLEQRRLVEENIGLVAVHLRRYVRNLAEPRRDREWDDLFQEGCLGLIQAAVTFREQRGIPFAAFALPRIHNAVSRALHHKFSLVYVPPKARVANSADPASADDNAKRASVKVHSLSEDAQRQLPDRRRHPFDSSGDQDQQGPARETVGHRLRSKYERALDGACDAVSRGCSKRGDRDKLVRILKEERFLIPREESKRALRQIARDTQSSYARVAQCDKQIGKTVRAALEADPEFHKLQQHARTDPNGADLTISEDFEAQLAMTSANEFVDRFAKADPPQRGKMLDVWMALSKCDFRAFAHAGVAGLSDLDREKLLSHCNTDGIVSERRPASRMPATACDRGTQEKG